MEWVFANLVGAWVAADWRLRLTENNNGSRLHLHLLQKIVLETKDGLKISKPNLTSMMLQVARRWPGAGGTRARCCPRWRISTTRCTRPSSPCHLPFRRPGSSINPQWTSSQNCFLFLGETCDQKWTFVPSIIERSVTLHIISMWPQHLPLLCPIHLLIPVYLTATARPWWVAVTCKFNPRQL